MRADYTRRGSKFICSRLVQTTLKSEQGPIKIYAKLTGINWNSPQLTWADSHGHHTHTGALVEARNRCYLESFFVILPVGNVTVKYGCHVLN